MNRAYGNDTKHKRLENNLLTQVFHPRGTDVGRENMTKNFTNSAMRSKDYAEELNASEEYLLHYEKLDTMF